MLDSIITSKTRIKLLLKFFINPDTSAYLRGLAEEFGESTNSIRIELNRMAKANLLNLSSNGRTKMYKANTSHPLFPELHSVVKKYLGIDHLIEKILSRLGNVELAFITGDYSRGFDSGIIDLIIIGNVDKNFLDDLIEKAEGIIKRKIRVLVLDIEEFKRLKETLRIDKSLLIWGKVEEFC